LIFFAENYDLMRQVFIVLTFVPIVFSWIVSVVKRHLFNNMKKGQLTDLAVRDNNKEIKADSDIQMNSVLITLLNIHAIIY
jgi:hypothetical protein